MRKIPLDVEGLVNKVIKRCNPITWATRRKEIYKIAPRMMVLAREKREKNLVVKKLKMEIPDSEDNVKKPRDKSIENLQWKKNFLLSKNLVVYYFAGLKIAVFLNPRKGSSKISSTSLFRSLLT